MLTEKHTAEADAFRSGFPGKNFNDSGLRPPRGFQPTG
jgi:hypothetical protein